MTAHAIGILSPKGGVGKSTITGGLTAVLAASTRRRLLVIDAGGQHNTLPYLDGCSKAGYLDNVDYDAADDDDTLSRLRQLDAGHLFQVIDLPGYARASEMLAVLRGHDDQPVADLLIVPMGPSEFDIESVVPFVQQVIVPSGIPYGVVLSKVHPLAGAEALDLRAQLGDSGIDVFASMVREYRGVRDAQRDRVPITHYGGRHSTIRRAEDDFRALTREVCHRLGSRLHIPTRSDNPQEEQHHG